MQVIITFLTIWCFGEKTDLKDWPQSVFLDDDWCWYASPFQVTEETIR